MKLDYREVNNMACTTKEEYEKALETRNYLSDWIRREKKIREDLINKLCTSQSCLNNYEALLSNTKEIIQKYEIYQEIKRDNENKKLLKDVQDYLTTDVDAIYEYAGKA